MKKRQAVIVFGFLLLCNFIHAAEIKINSLKELATYAAKSGNIIVMEPGVYQMEDYLTSEVVKNTKPDKVGRYAMIKFSGSHNVFDFTGVTIEVDTKLLIVFKARVSEFYVEGSHVHIKGLTVTDIGNHPKAKGGHSFTVAGDDAVIEKVTLNMSGSFPYGYGDLLGKGKGALVPLKKHSGMCIEGLNDKIIDCSIYSKSYGHCFFVQGGRNVLFENCYAEGVTRTTDDMLSEISGPAFDVNFASVYKNYAGENIITPGYTKSLNECGFRMYGKGGVNGVKTGAVTAINCTAKNTRIGFAFAKITGDVLIKDSKAIGCELGYNVGGLTVENSIGDAVNGPLLYVNKGEKTTVELALLPTESKTKVHVLAAIAGDYHNITLTKWRNMKRGQNLPIKIGVTRPPANNGFSPLGTVKTSGIVLNNSTEMSVELNSESSECKVISNGVVEDKGNNNEIIKK
ncbi:hypothetical protein AXE80_03430 [Wenyingzhuangia fucanilytica]|uniref:Right handed beta helix domain-containing protein n=1 Tax=Wenyingzhuangia fucanilytica TaxID=1790137 RepID=A0A1B1Y3N6_9FLAO|nr:hypothetical protein [Wenyingzhuangia fucanilytica]ANW95385.1 hypothetical protein AXE80_03430 [Wenyingzhuangia fucanilytica]